MNDFLQILFKLTPFKPRDLKQIVFGEKNVAVMLNNGSIGVCSTLCHQFNGDEGILINPDLSVYAHRIVVNAWINAVSNYLYPATGNADISEVIDFTKFNRVAMVGYFGSLAMKLQQKGVTISAFDLDESNKPVEPMSKLIETISFSDSVILTATSLSNHTFDGLIKSVSSNAKVFILGPSTPLTHRLFDIPAVCGLFGARFVPFDYEVLRAVGNGGGTRSYISRMQKTYILH